MEDPVDPQHKCLKVEYLGPFVLYQKTTETASYLKLFILHHSGTMRSKMEVGRVSAEAKKKQQISPERVIGGGVYKGCL